MTERTFGVPCRLPRFPVGTEANLVDIQSQMQALQPTLMAIDAIVAARIQGTLESWRNAVLESKDVSLILLWNACYIQAGGHPNELIPTGSAAQDVA